MPSSIGNGTTAAQGRVPKAAVFLRCEANHVFTTTCLITDYPAGEEVARIFAPCPACPAKSSVYPHASIAHDCAFCGKRMTAKASPHWTGTCDTPGCWFGRAVVATDPRVWAEVYQQSKNCFFYGGDQVKTEGDGNAAPADMEAAETLINMSKGIGGGK